MVNNQQRPTTAAHVLSHLQQQQHIIYKNILLQNCSIVEIINLAGNQQAQAASIICCNTIIIIIITSSTENCLMWRPKVCSTPASFSKAESLNKSQTTQKFLAKKKSELQTAAHNGAIKCKCAETNFFLLWFLDLLLINTSTSAWQISKIFIIIVIVINTP